MPFSPNEPPPVALAAPSVKLLVTVEEAADALSVSRSVLYSLMGRGDLAYVLIGRSRRLPVDGLKRFVDRETLRRGFPT